jgi:CP family cyanate transporter-like MFS transporter
VLFFGIQSLGFYAILGWLPTALLSKGFTDGDISFYLGIATSIGIPFGLAMSSILGRFKSLAWWASGSSAVSAAGFAGLATSLSSSNTDELILLLSSILIGIGQASTFPISLSLVSIRASSSGATTQLSAMTQGIGYLISALGTFVVGVLATATGSWAVSLWLLTALTVLQMVCGYIAGKPSVVQDNKKPRVK